MSETIDVQITKNFEHNLESIRCYLHQHHQPEYYEQLLDNLFDTIIPNLQSHPMIGFDFLAQTVSSIEELKQMERIQTSLPESTSIRQYNDRDYFLLYSLQASQVALLAIKYRLQMRYELGGVD